jgi:hypothetical protein
MGLKKAFVSSMLVLPGVMPRKQVPAHWIGSANIGSIVALALSGDNVASGVSVVVGEGISVTVCVDVEVGATSGLVAAGSNSTCVGWMVELTGTHPVNAKMRIKRKDNQEKCFMM